MQGLEHPPGSQTDRGGSEPVRTLRRDALRVLVFTAAFFAYLAGHRIVDDDEGYYALAGSALAGGRLLYRDLFFPQVPLSAVANAVIQSVFAPGLVPLRAFSAVCAVCTALLVHRAAHRVVPPEAARRAGIVAVVLFVAHALVWEWAPTVKTYPLGLLLAMAALVTATPEDLGPRRALAAGLLSGLTVSARALSAPVVLGVAVAVFARRTDGAARRALVAPWAAGLSLGLAPLALFGAMDPAAFWFDNVGYHALRGPGEGLVKDAAQKVDTLRAVFLSPLGAVRADATGVQTTALAVAAVFGLVALRKEPRMATRLAPFAVTAGGIAGLALLPSPTWVQYFAPAVAPASVVVAAWAASRFRHRVALSLGLVAYAAVAVPQFLERVVREDPIFRPAALDAVGHALDGVTREGDVVAAHWPSYLAASHRRPLDAARNQFARLVADRVSEAERRRFHLYTEAEFRDAILAGQVQAFVVGTFAVPETLIAMKASEWRKVAAFPGATIVRRDAAPPAARGAGP